MRWHALLHAQQHANPSRRKSESRGCSLTPPPSPNATSPKRAAMKCLRGATRPMSWRWPASPCQKSSLRCAGSSARNSSRPNNIAKLRPISSPILRTLPSATSTHASCTARFNCWRKMYCAVWMPYMSPARSPCLLMCLSRLIKGKAMQPGKRA
jgi:hypothetical protein